MSALGNFWMCFAIGRQLGAALNSQIHSGKDLEGLDIGVALLQHVPARKNVSHSLQHGELSHLVVLKVNRKVRINHQPRDGRPQPLAPAMPRFATCVRHGQNG